MNVEMGNVVDARRNVAVRVPVEQHPLERQVLATRDRVGQRQHVLAVFAGKPVERRLRERDPDRGRHAARIDLREARRRPVAERRLPAERPGRRLFGRERRATGEQRKRNPWQPHRPTVHRDLRAERKAASRERRTLRRPIAAVKRSVW
jgi:hypothetical protein